MQKSTLVAFLMTATTLFSIPPAVQADHVFTGGVVHRRGNLGNEFETNTPEGINARGYAEVKSRNSRHHVKIRVNGLLPGETYVILNHWFEPIPDRGVPRSGDLPPSCTGHFQFLGEPVQADKKGRLSMNKTFDQLAPHIWVVNFAKFMEVTDGFKHAPNSVDAFIIGGLLLPYADIVEVEDQFDDNGRLIEEGPASGCTDS